MKSIVYIILLTVSFAFCLGCTNSDNNILGGLFNTEEEVEPEDSTVWICKGPMSKCYHKSKNCRGLKSCSKDIDTVSIAQADSMGKKPCGSCIHKK